MAMKVLARVNLKKGVNPRHYDFGFSTTPSLTGVTRWYKYNEQPVLAEGTYYVFLRHYLTKQIKSIKAYALDCDGSLEICSLVYIGTSLTKPVTVCQLFYTGLNFSGSGNCTIAYIGLSDSSVIDTGNPPVTDPDDQNVKPTGDIYTRPVVRGINTCNPLSDNPGVCQITFELNDSKTMWYPVIKRGSAFPDMGLYIVVSGRSSTTFWPASQVHKQMLFDFGFPVSFRCYLMSGAPDVSQRGDNGRNCQQMFNIV